jgi:hypothetical protein
MLGREGLQADQFMPVVALCRVRDSMHSLLCAGQRRHIDYGFGKPPIYVVLHLANIASSTSQPQPQGCRAWVAVQLEVPCTIPDVPGDAIKVRSAPAVRRSSGWLTQFNPADKAGAP